MTIHLRSAGTSLVLDLPPDRFPVVRHWGEDLGPLEGEDLADARRAATTTLGINAHWMTNDLPVLPLAHLGWSARPAVLVSRTDGTAFSPHPAAVEHETATEEGPAGTVRIVRSSGRDVENLLTLGTELRLEPSGLVRLRAWVSDDRPADQAGSAGADLVIGEITPVLPVPHDADQLVDLSGHHCLERMIQRTPFSPGTRVRESWEGRPGHDAATWLVAGAEGFGWRSGRVHAVHPA